MSVRTGETPAVQLPADRLVALLDHLGIAKAHIATQIPADIAGLATEHAERLGGIVLNIVADGAPSGASKLFVRRHDMQIGPAGSGALEGAVRHVRTFGPIQRAQVALSAGGGETVIEVDAPRDRELQTGDIVGLQPRRYRIFAAQD